MQRTNSNNVGIKKIAEEEITQAASLEIPENIKLLFQKELSKKEQISLLRGVSIKTEQLGAIFYMLMTEGTNSAITDLQTYQKIHRCRLAIIYSSM